MIGFKSTKETITGKYAEAIRKASLSSDPRSYQTEEMAKKEYRTSEHVITWGKK